MLLSSPSICCCVGACDDACLPSDHRTARSRAIARRFRDLSSFPSRLSSSASVPDGILRHPLSVAALNSAEHRKSQEAAAATRQDEDEDEDLCPVECVKEFRTNAELAAFLDAAKAKNALVVVDFYRTACGSCKYIEQGFIKLCKGAGDDDEAVIFLKHNVMDEYDEQSEVAEQLKIKVVPLFHFYKDGRLVEAFPTREKGKIFETIQTYISLRAK